MTIHMKRVRLKMDSGVVRHGAPGIFTAGWRSGATAMRRSAMRRGSTPGTTTGVGPARCTSTRSKVLVAAAFLAPPPPGDPPGEPASVPGVLRVRPQRPGPLQEAVRGPDRPIIGTTLQSILSLD